MTARYAREVAAEYVAIGREMRAACPRAWALSVDLNTLLCKLAVDDPAWRQMGSHQRHMLRALDRRRDVSKETERFVRMAMYAVNA